MRQVVHGATSCGFDDAVHPSPAATYCTPHVDEGGGGGAASPQPAGEPLERQQAEKYLQRHPKLRQRCDTRSRVRLCVTYEDCATHCSGEQQRVAPSVHASYTSPAPAGFGSGQYL